MEIALALVLGILILGYSIWFLTGLVRYIWSGQYAIDRYLQEASSKS